GKSTNYDTDLFLPSLKQISFICEKDYASAKEVDKKSMRVIADHIRAMTFLIADGILPSKEGRGYVLRRIMRRAIRYGKRLGINKPFLSELSTVVINQFSDHYPELVEKRQRIKDAIGEEEIQFEKTIHQGLQILNDEIIKLKSSGARMFPGELGFRLYDTYGFPVDLTNDVLREQGFTLDQAAYDEAFVSHREKARGSWKGSQSNDLIHLISAWRKAKVTTEFVGYETLSTEARIIKIAVGGKEVNVAVENDECEIVCDRTPFYGESGGQMGDIGVMTSKHCSIEVIDTKKYDSNLHVHFCKIVEGQLNLGDNVNLSVDQKARQATAKNHTATHILHATLIDILGDHIEQKGSLVAPERLRFDFSHSRSLTDTEIFKIEQTINERIWQNDTVSSATMPLDEAVTAGAKALFNEKYGDEVRVISVGRYSKELCGGTHLLRAGEIGFFKIVKESSVAAGIRRIEAFTGSRALRYIADLDLGFKKLSQTLGVSIDKVPERVSALLTRQKDSKKNGDLNKSSDIQATTETINKIEFAYGVIDDPELRDVRNFADRLLEKHPKAIVVVANKSTGVMAIKVSSEIKIFKANECVDFLKSELGVSGGGKPNMAQVAGLGKNHITQAIDHIKKQIKNIKV
ncbi:MAG: alanine--tRNA ligase, partial [Bdellovibrionales bacterium]|nr:alanine--tRNA ligase [Bdellovibrionales bacterium]